MLASKADHETFLRRAIELSARASAECSTGGAFGGVLPGGCRAGVLRRLGRRPGPVGDFDDRPIHEELTLPRERRSIRLTQMLRDEAVVVWKKCASKPDRVHC